MGASAPSTSRHPSLIVRRRADRKLPLSFSCLAGLLLARAGVTDKQTQKVSARDNCRRIPGGGTGSRGRSLRSSYRLAGEYVKPSNSLSTASTSRFPSTSWLRERDRWPIWAAWLSFFKGTCSPLSVLLSSAYQTSFTHGSRPLTFSSHHHDLSPENQQAQHLALHALSPLFQGRLHAHPGQA